METSEYESFVQWLPREMIEDVFSLLTNDEVEEQEQELKKDTFDMEFDFYLDCKFWASDDEMRGDGEEQEEEPEEESEGGK